MKPEWETYLNEMQVSAVLKSAIEERLQVAAKLCPEPIDDLLLTDYVDNEDRRSLESIWFLSKSYALEAKNFISSSNCDLAILRDNIAYFDVKWEDFDFEKATSKSRLNVRFQLLDGVEGEMRASGGNCEVLWRFFSTRIRPNLWQPDEEDKSVEQETS